MPENFTARFSELVAVDANGITYIIERRYRSVTCHDGAWANHYCCLRDGRPVTWLGESHYQLNDGTALLAIECRLPNLAALT